MKKLALLLIGVLLGFLLCYFFFGKEKMTDDEIVNPRPPEGYIESPQMKKLSDAFKERHDIINKTLGIEDNRSSWYSLKQMRGFLDYAEFEANKGQHKMDGVRIYLGANGAGKGMTTMFLVPTSSSVKEQGRYSKGSMFNLNMNFRADGGDIPGAGGMDYGGQGDPPGSGYPNPPQ